MMIPPFLQKVALTAEALAPLVQQAALLSDKDTMAIVGSSLQLAGVSADDEDVAIAHGFLAEVTMATTGDNSMTSVVFDHIGPMGIPYGTWQILVKRLLTLPLAQGAVEQPMSEEQVSDAVDALPLPVVLVPGPSFFQDMFTDTDDTEGVMAEAARFGCDIIIGVMGGIRKVPIGFCDSTPFLVARFGGMDASLLHTTFTRIA